jgi:eukaryotic-like serine/threonine-protein kinase
MSEPSIEQFGGVLAAPPGRPWRLMVAVAVAALAMVLIAAGVVIVTAKPAVPHARNLIATIKDPRGSKGASAGAFSPDGRTLAIADSNGDTYLWDVATGTKVAVLTDPHATDPDSTTFVDSVAFSPDGKTLAVGDDRQTTIWDLATHRVAATLTDPSGGSELDGSGTANALAFSPDGTTLAVGDGNGNIYLWDVASRRVIATFAQPVDPLLCNAAYNQQGEDSYGLVVPGGGPLGASVAFSPDGRFLATDVECGRGVYLWNVARHTRSVTLEGSGFDAFATPVVFSPDGGMVANFDGATRVWRVGAI